VTDSADAVRLVGLLADDDRRAVVAALVLGASTVNDIRGETGLDTRAVVTALHRLVEGDLVVASDGGHHQLLGEAFRLAARAAAPQRPPPDTDAPPDAARVLKAFVHDDRLTSIPASRSKRLVVLDLIAQDFEPGERYGEPRVNAMLGRWHDDHAALRRHLVDEAFLTREGGVYWRSGGSYAP
jgi:hypothetical protein